MKKRDNFDSDKAYGEYVGQNVVGGSVVRLRMDNQSLKMGHLGYVVSQTPYPGEGYLLNVNWSGRLVSLFSHRVEIQTPMPQ